MVSIRGIKQKLVMTSIIIVSSLIFSITMSSNAYAYDITTPVQPTGRAWSAEGTYWWTTVSPDTGGYYSSTASNTRAIFLNKGTLPNKQIGATHILNAIQTTTINAEYGKYYLIKLNYTFQNKSTSSTFPSVVRIVTSGQPAFTLMSVSTEYVPCTQWAPATGNNAYQPLNYQNACTWGGVIYNIIVQARDTGNFPIQLGLTNTDMFRSYIAEFSENTNLNIGTISIEDIMEFSKVELGDGTKQLMESEKQADQQAGQQSQSDAGSAGQQVEGATTNILGVLTGFIGAFTSASATNCIFNTGTILGNMDMCSTEIPAVFNVILSLVSILVLVPMAIWLFNSIINAFKEFQQ